LKNGVIVLTFFGLWLSTQFDLVVQDYVAYVLILTFGILHGANDITLINSLSDARVKSRRLLATYLAAIALVSLLFLISKGLALAFFVFISAYHFGEQHLNHHLRVGKRLSIPFFTLYGLLILFMIFIIKFDKVKYVIEDISGFIVIENVLAGILIAIAVALLILSIYLYRKGLLKVNPVMELFYLSVLAIVFANASLIWGFAIYFIFWHSLPSMRDQLLHLYGSANKDALLKYIKTSGPYWLISVAGLFLLYWLLKDSVDFFISVVLYVLAAITFPHVLVMSKVEPFKNSP